MSSPTSDVVVLCWNEPTTSDQRAHKIATFLGAKATFVSLSPILGDATSIRELVGKCVCLVVEAETLARAADATAAGTDVADFLTDLALHIFTHGFQPTDRHCRLLKHISEGSLLAAEVLTGQEVKFRVADGQRQWCGPFTGLSVGTGQSSGELVFLGGTEHPKAEVMIQAGGRPFLVRMQKGQAKVFFSGSSELADLDEGVSRESHPSSWFSKLLPLLMFLRGALGNRVWHNDRPQACFIVDDPLLTGRYGFLNHKSLLERMNKGRFSACIAFIPWNYRRSSNQVAALISSQYNLPYLCIHGCDHTEGEFASIDGDALRGKAQLALERMRTHEQVSGVSFDDVMVFPQGLFSVEAMTALEATGYLAAVNSHVFPSTTGKGILLRDLLEAAVTVYSDMPLFGRRYPDDVAGFAFDLFMGKPALAVEHHSYFRNGYEPLEAFVEQLNSLDGRLQWESLGTICSGAHLIRADGDSALWIRFYTNRFSFQNTDTQSKRCTFVRRQKSPGKATCVTVDGLSWSAEQVDGHVEIRKSLDPGQVVEIYVSDGTDNLFNTVWKPTSIHNAKVFVRRLLCEFRDNWVGTNAALNAIYSALRNMIRGAERARY